MDKVPSTTLAEPRRAADCLQPTLPRSRFRQRLTPGVRLRKFVRERKETR